MTGATASPLRSAAPPVVAVLLFLFPAATLGGGDQAPEREVGWTLVRGDEQGFPGRLPVTLVLDDGRSLPLTSEAPKPGIGGGGLDASSVRVRRLEPEGPILVRWQDMAEGMGLYTTSHYRVLGPAPDDPAALSGEVMLFGKAGGLQYTEASYRIDSEAGVVTLREERFTQRTQSRPGPLFDYDEEIEGEEHFIARVETVETRRWRLRGSRAEPIGHTLHYRVQEGDTLEEVVEGLAFSGEEQIRPEWVELGPDESFPPPGEWLQIERPAAGSGSAGTERSFPELRRQLVTGDWRMYFPFLSVMPADGWPIQFRESGAVWIDDVFSSDGGRRRFAERWELAEDGSLLLLADTYPDLGRLRRRSDGTFVSISPTRGGLEWPMLWVFPRSHAFRDILAPEEELSAIYLELFPQLLRSAAPEILDHFARHGIRLEPVTDGAGLDPRYRVVRPGSERFTLVLPIWRFPPDTTEDEVRSRLLDYDTPRAISGRYVLWSPIVEFPRGIHATRDPDEVSRLRRRVIDVFQLLGE